MAITRGKLEGRITVPASTTVTIVDSNDPSTANVTLTAGTYYLSSADSTANDLLAQLAADFSAAGAGDTWTFTISAGESGTGLVSINDTSHTSWDIDWTTTTNGTYLRDILGFTGNITNQNGAATGSNHAKYLWLPDGPMMTPYGDAVPMRETDYRTVTSQAGHVSAVYGQRRAVYSAKWRVSRDLVHANEETTTGQSWEQFWLDCILGEHNFATVGGPLRLYWDADTDGTYVTVKPTENVVDLDPAKLQDDFVGIYDIMLNRLIEVPS